MSKRSISSHKRTWLLAELQAWRDGGILSADQPPRILDLYESAEDISRRKTSVALFALMSIAAFFVGLAALLIIGFNWEAMPRAVKLAIIFGVIGGTYALGFWLRFSRKAPRASELVFFLGCLFYGCGIWLVAQVFQISGHYPNGLWMWALGTLPFALCLDTLLLHALVVALLAIWVGTEILDFGLFWRPWFFGRWFRFPSACFSLPLLALPGLLWAYRKRSAVTVALYVPLLAWWVILQPVAFHTSVNVVYFIGAAGALFLAFAEMHAVGSPMARPYRFFGVLTTAGILSLMSFGDAVADLLQRNPDQWYRSGISAGIIALAGMAAIVIADVFKPTEADAPRPSGIPFVDIFRRQWLPIGLIFLMAGLCLWNASFAEPSYHPRFGMSPLERWSLFIVVPTVVANVAMIAFAIWLIRVGMREEHGLVFAAGVMMFLAWAVFRYIDLFAGVGGMLGGALLFLICGVAIFGVARYWMQRKEISHV